MSASLQEKSKHKKKSSFFSELSPHIEYASIFDRELDRRVAHKFNVFDFLDKKEIGLSQIIAHLLNPSASHGQGALFLQHFLRLVTNDGNWDYLNSNNVKVGTEHSTANNRRIDIHVASWGEEPFRLAIENKPYAGDPKNQVLDYLKDLKKKPGDFLLVYISPNGKGPSERSLPRKNRSKWEEKFKVMAYAKSNYDQDATKDTVDESFKLQRVNEPLTTWFKICKKECEVDRLRWFLGDAENFCTKTFGDSNSIDDVEVLTVKKFLLKNKKYLNTAYAVNRAWPNVVNEIVGSFFEQLTNKIKRKINEKYSARDDFEFKSSLTFDEDKGFIYMNLYSTKWVNFENGKSGTENRYGIVLSNVTKNSPDNWYVGVESPKKKVKMKRHEQDLLEIINTKLNALKDSGLEIKDDAELGYMSAEDGQQNWEQFLEKLLDETKQEGGEISDYYVNFFLEFAERAISILDDIENHKAHLRSLL